MQKKLLSLFITILMTLSIIVVNAQNPITLTSSPFVNPNEVRVVDSIMLNFSEAITPESATGKISIAKVDGTEVLITIFQGDNANSLEIVSTTNLEYLTRYILTVDGVQIPFSTTPNPLNTLFYETFDNESSLNNFTSFVQMDASEKESIGVVDGKLKMVGDVGNWSSLPYNQRPLLKINDSENWSDYEIMGKVSTPPETVYADANIVFRAENHQTANYSLMNRIRTNATPTDVVSIRKNDKTNIMDYTNIEAFNVGKEYNFSLKANGSAISYDIDAEDAKYTHYEIVDSDRTKGAIALGSYKGTVIYDDILVKDLGISVTPSSIYNITDKFDLVFSENVDFTSFKNDLSIKLNNVDVAYTINQKSLNTLEIILENPVLNSVYDVAIGNTSIFGNSKTLQTPKCYQFKTAKATDNLIMVDSFPKNNEKSVSTVDNMKVIFSKNVDLQSAKGNISLTDFDNHIIPTSIQFGLSENEIILKPLQQLANLKSYNIVIDSGLMANTSELYNKQTKTTFETEPNPLNTLFYETFDNESSLNNFTPFVQMDASGKESISVVDGKLKMVGDAGNWSSLPYNQRPLLKINGSENWSDYEIMGKVSTPSETKYADANIVFRAENFQTANYSLMNRIKTNATSTDVVSIRKNDKTNIIDHQNIEAFNVGKEYNFVLKANGSLVSYDIDSEDTKYRHFEVMDSERTTGAIAIGSYMGTVIYDDILVKDLGVGVGVDNRFNVSEGFTLTFSEEVNLATLKNNLVIRKNQTTIDYTLTATNSKVFEVKVPLLETDSIYNVEISKSMTFDSGKTFTNNKKFDFRTASTFDKFTVTNSSVKNGDVEVGVINDFVINFSKDLDVNNAKANIILKDSNQNNIACEMVYGNDNKSIIISPTVTLNYLNKYILSVSGLLTAHDGQQIDSEINILFETQPNPITTLFYETFSCVEALNKLTPFVELDASGKESFNVVDGKLKLVADAGDWSGSAYNRRPLLKINGSEDWSDYEITGKLSTPLATFYADANVLIRAANYQTANYSLTTRIRTNAEAKDVVSIRKNDKTNIIDHQNIEAFNVGKQYNFILKANGNAISYDIDGENPQYRHFEVVDSDRQTGAIALGSYVGTIEFDDILVRDLGLTFSVDKLKNVGNEFVLTFSEDVSAVTLKNYISLSNKIGPVTNFSCEQINSNSVKVTAPSLLEESIYDVSISKSFTALSGKPLTTAKSFEIKTKKSPITVSAYGVNNANGVIKYLTSGESIHAKATITLTQDITTTAVLGLAVYEKGKLIDIKISNLYNLDANNLTADLVTPTIVLPNDIELVTVKAFIWKDLYSMIPLKNFITLEKKTDLALYISAKSGNDQNKGTLAEPLSTLSKALEVVKEKRLNQISDEITLYFSEGTYEIGDVSINANHSNLIIKPYKNEKVVFTGGTKLDNSGFSKVTDSNILSKLPQQSRNNVYEYNYNNVMNEIPKITFLSQAIAFDNLTIGETQGVLARYPNNGYINVSSVQTSEVGSKFTIDSQKTLEWQNASDAWVCGYWQYNWAMDSLKVDNIIDHIITTVEKPSLDDKNIKQNSKFYIYNLLEEMDKEGEWYFDKNTKKLYLYTSDEQKLNSVYISNNENNALKIGNAININIYGINFNNFKGNAINVSDSSNINVKNCGIKNVSLLAVNMFNSQNSGIYNSTIESCGAGAIILNGGNRKTLEKGNLVAKDNVIQNYATTYKVYRPAVNLVGVGNSALNNTIFNAPHNAITFYGNDHTIDKNDISDVLKETSDAGAIYCGRDWTTRGNMITNNYIHDVKGISSDVIAIYLDDGFSSATVEKNIIYNVPRGIMVGGGRNNIVRYNVVAVSPNKAYPSIKADQRGLSSSFEQLFSPTGDLMVRLNSVPYKSPIYSKYENLSNILQDEPKLPKYNVIANNIIYKHNILDIATEVVNYGVVSNNVETEQSIFVNENSGNMSLNMQAVNALIKEFPEILFSQIGAAK